MPTKITRFESHNLIEEIKRQTFDSLGRFEAKTFLRQKCKEVDTLQNYIKSTIGFHYDFRFLRKRLF